jgi:DNA-directed RNA polymerase subunit RPC12/RpoP
MKVHKYKYICKFCGAEYTKLEPKEDEMCDQCYQMRLLNVTPKL